MAGKRGALIVLEGCDRVGKSTQARLLVQNLCAHGRPAQLLNFPDRTTEIGQMLDQYLKQDKELDDHAVHLLFSANRWECASRLKKQLHEGTTLIVDRYSDSGIAFSAAKGLPLDWCAASDAGLPRPDLVLFLTLATSQTKERGGYGHERYEEETFQDKVRSNFDQLRCDYWTVISADSKTKEELQAEVLVHALVAADGARDKPLLQLG